MPCDIGYKDISRIRVKPKLPQEFKEKIKAPKPDKGLLDNLGIDDAIFLEWVSGLDINPLLNEALKRALKAVGDIGKVEFRITNGELEISSKYMDAKEKRGIESIAKNISERFQLETIGIIAQLLDYTIEFSERAAGSNKFMTVEGEKEESADVHKYLRVSIGANGEGVLAFEHFESQASLKQERAKFLALARKFGIKLMVSEERESGQPIPQNVEHRDFLRQGGTI